MFIYFFKALLCLVGTCAVVIKFCVLFTLLGILVGGLLPADYNVQFSQQALGALLQGRIPEAEMCRHLYLNKLTSREWYFKFFFVCVCVYVCMWCQQ